ncbi:MAG: DNA translocase FtsK, partial [Cytophagales bacterium]|nr:DNA translocase FtsK [Armatimonadota bacterium]
MATARPERPSPAPRKPQPPRGAKPRAPTTSVRQRANTRLAYDIVGVALAAAGLILLATLIWPPPEAVQENIFGVAVVHGLRLLVGAGAWVFPLVLLVTGFMLGVGKSRSWDNIGGVVAAFLIFLTWWHLGHVPPAGQFAADNLLNHGGYIGATLSLALRASIGSVGGHIVLTALSVVAFLWITDIPLPALVGPVERIFGTGSRAVASGARSAAQRIAERRANRLFAPDDDAESAVPTHRAAPGGLIGKMASRPRLFTRRTPEPAESEDDGPGSDAATLPGRRVDLLAEQVAASPPTLFPTRKTAKREARETGETDEADAPPIPFVATRPRGIDETAPAIADVRKFVLPPLTLLRAGAIQVKPQAGESEARREVLLQTLEDFGIGADISHVAYGPAITRYEVALERGIKVSKIVSLADNLAMALAAIDVRVEAPIPGKSAIGIEIPNEHPTMVTLRECVERDEFRNASSKLTFALGKDVTGVCRYADLAKMPHLLIGGSTGSGKSVGINTLICSLLYRCTPRELKFLMIDPKKVELSLYAGIPHLAAPVITNVKQAPSIFKTALREMETRYDKFAKAGTRNLEGYNSRVAEEEKLPYWVLIVDELADLMMTSGPEIETSICRLAQLARATGIHLVIATQRPSVNVITGTIKANISSRIAFAVNSAVDSRTILDMTGADRLIGRGDMLFMPMDAAKPSRIQGCFVSEQETEALVSYLKQQAQPTYEVMPSTLSLADGEDDSGENDSEDDLFEAAVKLVVTGGAASTSMLQRRFKIGYTRAARLVDIMEQKGIVGPLDGAKPRDIL